MAEKLTKEVYLQYAKKIVSVLSGDAFYQKYRDRVSGGASNVKLAKKRLIQDIAVDWIDTIEDCLPNLDTIVRNPRKFIVQEEDIVDISLAKSISTESVKHLAQHTNMISQVDKDGMVTPNRILNITKEESYEIYENRFIYTLLLKLKDFVTMRYDKIKKASSTQDVLELDVESRFNLPSKKITYRSEYLAQLSFDEVMQLDPETLTKIERIAKIDRIITDFLSSSFAKQMRNSAPVRPPITRTNVILKEPNFKKALTLWQFIETYQVTGGFSTSDEVEDYPVQAESVEQLKNMVTLNTMLFESLYDQHETDMDMADKEFADFVRVGNMQFEPDKMTRDEYAQKPEEQENSQAEHKKETKPTEKEEESPEIPEESKASEKTENEKEIPYDEFADEEPNAEEFDRQLFDVRKLYKRPEEDKIKQEYIIKIKDAIDRCFTSYRKIKQDELNARERAERTRLRNLEMQKRTDAFIKRRDKVLSKLAEDESAYFGTDPFGSKAVIIKKVEKKSVADTLKIDKNEKLDFDDKDLENINQSIIEMEKNDAERAERTAKEEAAENIEYEEALKANKLLDDAVNKENTLSKQAKEKSQESENTSDFAEKVREILSSAEIGAAQSGIVGKEPFDNEITNYETDTAYEASVQSGEDEKAFETDAPVEFEEFKRDSEAEVTERESEAESVGRNSTADSDEGWEIVEIIPPSALVTNGDINVAEEKSNAAGEAASLKASDGKKKKIKINLSSIGANNIEDALSKTDFGSKKAVIKPQNSDKKDGEQL